MPPAPIPTSDNPMKTTARVSGKSNSQLGPIRNTENAIIKIATFMTIFLLNAEEMNPIIGHEMTNVKAIAANPNPASLVDKPKSYSQRASVGSK